MYRECSSQEFFGGNSSVPLHSRPTKGLSVKEALEIILSCKEEKVCKRKPISCQENALFVISREAVDNIEDLKADDNGIWDWGGKPRSYHAVKCNEEGQIVRVRPMKYHDDPISSTEEVYELTRLYERHRGTREYHRILYFVKDSSGKDIPNVILQYFFEGGNVLPVKIPTHGHRKTLQRPHYVVQKSTRNKVKEIAKTSKAHKVIQAINSDACSSKSASEEVRNKSQIYNARRFPSTPVRERKDSLFELIEQCKQHHTQEDQGYVREVTFTKSPVCILATHQQLREMSHFCTGENVFNIVGVDGTFNLGPFYVTVMTYTNSMVENVTNHKMPTFIGPIMVHMEKTAEVYKHFFTQVVKYCPLLRNIRTFGTDGEQALVNGLKDVFGSKCVYLRCFKHFKDDILRKLTSTGFPDWSKRVIINDIFGYTQGDTYIKGLLDSEDCQEFRQKMEAVKDKWNELEQRSCDRNHPNFHSWMMQYKFDVAVSTMLASVRKAAGLGNPPVQYTQNRNESINRLLKDRTDYTKCSWAGLNDILYELVKNQESEFERSITSSGEYQLLNQYRHLEVSRRVWNHWDEEQRRAAIKRLRVAPLSRPLNEQQQQQQQQQQMLASLSVSCNESGITTLPQSILESMWNKASTLINTPGQVLRAAGLNSNSRSVASASGSPPHIVTRYPSGRVACDSNCHMWKATRLCSHCLAAAEDMGCLPELLSWYVRSNQSVNITAVATDGLPPGVGKKPSDRSYSRKKQKVQAVRRQVDPFSSFGSSQQTTIGRVTLSNPPIQSTCITTSLNQGPITSTSVLASTPMSVAPNPAVLHLPSTSILPPVSSVSIRRPSAATTCTSAIIPFAATTTTSAFVPPAATAVMSASNAISVCPSIITSAINTVSAGPSAAATIMSAINASTGNAAATTTPSLVTSSNIQMQLQLLQTALLLNNLQSSSRSATQPTNVLGCTPTQPFQVTTLTNKVKKCYGCNVAFTQHEREPPNNLVVCHPEFRAYRNSEGELQMNRQMQNTYYHLKKSCIQARYPSFQGQINVPSDISAQLLPAQRSYIQSQFGQLTDLTVGRAARAVVTEPLSHFVFQSH